MCPCGGGDSDMYVMLTSCLCNVHDVTYVTLGISLGAGGVGTVGVTGCSIFKMCSFGNQSLP